MQPVSPDEYPFTKDLPGPLIPPLTFPEILYNHPNCRNLNVNPSILSFYTRNIVPRVTQRATLDLATRKRAQGIAGDQEYEDDGNYGSAATIDVELLHAISKRVHYGAYIKLDLTTRTDSRPVTDTLFLESQASSSQNPSSSQIQLPSSRISWPRTGPL